MIYDLKIEIDKQNAVERFKILYDQQARIELKKKINRTLKQNAYLHVLLGAYGLHFGYTINEAKDIYKDLNSDIYEYEKKGRTFIKSSAKIDSGEMTISIERFRDHSMEGGLYLASPDEKELLLSYEKDVVNGQRWL